MRASRYPPLRERKGNSLPCAAPNPNAVLSGLRGRRAPHENRDRDAAERAFLVGLDYRQRCAGLEPRTRVRDGHAVPPSARAARNAASVPAEAKSARQPLFSAEESLAELKELATSAGAQVVGEFLQHRDKPDPATLIGRGKLEEIAGAAAMSGADLIIFDHDLSPSQQRNIENEVKPRVIDRTQLILDIFARHARTREGQLQVELAQLQYLLPRLTGRGVEMSQLGRRHRDPGPG